MIGLALSVFFGLILFGFGKRWQDIYHKTTVLLLWWNLVITLFLVSTLITGTVFMAGLAGLVSGIIGFLFGLTGGGLALSVLMFFMITMSVIQTLGALLLKNSLVIYPNEGYKFNKRTLLTGVIFFTIGLTRIFG